MSRILAQFSCGAASAVATKLALAQYGDRVHIVNAFIKNEDDDNRRFLADCETWFGRTITVLRDVKYGADVIQVFRKVGFIKGPRGAACTTRIKRGLLQTFEQPGDVLVLGYTADEEWRYDDWVQRQPDRPIIAPLVERGLTKEDCKAMVERAGIVLPMQYRRGYANANCKVCVKGATATCAQLAKTSRSSSPKCATQRTTCIHCMATTPASCATAPGHSRASGLPCATCQTAPLIETTARQSAAFSANPLNRSTAHERPDPRQAVGRHLRPGPCQRPHLVPMQRRSRHRR